MSGFYRQYVADFLTAYATDQCRLRPHWPVLGRCADARVSAELDGGELRRAVIFCVNCGGAVCLVAGAAVFR